MIGMKWKTLGVAGALAASLWGGMPSEAEAQGQGQKLSGSIEAILSEEAAKSYARLHATYQLPGGLSGYTFIEGYQDGSYFAKSTLTKKAGDYLSLKGQVLQRGELFSMAGIGAGAKLPMPQGSYAGVYAVPLWIGKDGLVHDRSIFGYSAGVKLGHGYSIGSVGEIQLAAKGGPQWAYGEIKAAKAIGQLEFSYEPALRSKGSLLPRLEHRVSVSYKF